MPAASRQAVWAWCSPCAVTWSVVRAVPFSARHRPSKARTDVVSEPVPAVIGRRISTSLAVPNVLASGCSKPAPRSDSRMRSRLAACGYFTSTTVPPLNSIDRCRPLVARKNTAATNVSADTTLKIVAKRMNGMSL